MRPLFRGSSHRSVRAAGWLGALTFAAIVAACASDPSPKTHEDDRDSGSSELDARSTITDAVPFVEEPADSRFVDTCNPKAAVCTPTVATEGGGLLAIDRCAYGLKESATIDSPNAIIAALEKIATRTPVSDLMTDLNRVATPTTTIPGAPPGVKLGFRWNDEDEASTAWTPQGITGSADADPTGLVAQKRIVLVSWYDSSAADKGVRIAFVDITDPKLPKYRLALLVAPTGSAAAPSIAATRVHAGGIVWFGHYLYVVETGKGFRVFDMDHILRVAVDTEVIGCDGSSCRAGTYRYAIPQIGTYSSQSACSPIFSFVGLDRSANPPTLVTGEYCSTTACSNALAGRALHWPLDPTTGLLRSATTYPVEAYLMGQKQVQGGLSRNGLHFFSSSEPAAGAGALYRVQGKKSAASKWIDAPEDLMIDETNKVLFGLSEGVDARFVFAADLASYPAP